MREKAACGKAASETERFFSSLERVNVFALQKPPSANSLLYPAGLRRQ